MPTFALRHASWWLPLSLCHSSDCFAMSHLDTSSSYRRSGKSVAQLSHFLNRWNGHRTCQSPLIPHRAELYSGTQLPVYTCLYPLGGLVEGIISNWESITVAKRHVENGIARSGWEWEWEVKSKKTQAVFIHAPSLNLLISNRHESMVVELHFPSTLWTEQ